MTDRPLFNLDAEARWQLAYDQHQWIIQYREAKKTYRLGAKGKNSGWRDRSYVNGKKRDPLATLPRAGHPPLRRGGPAGGLHAGDILPLPSRARPGNRPT